HTARVAGILAGAATAGAGTQGRRVGTQREVDAHHVVTGCHGAGGGHGGVHSPAHRREYPHDTAPVRSSPRPATRARSAAGPSAAIAPSTSSAVAVSPGLSRRLDRKSTR